MNEWIIFHDINYNVVHFKISSPTLQVSLSPAALCETRAAPCQRLGLQRREVPGPAADGAHGTAPKVLCPAGPGVHSIRRFRRCASTPLQRPRAARRPPHPRLRQQRYGLHSKTLFLDTQRSAHQRVFRQWSWPVGAGRERRRFAEDQRSEWRAAEEQRDGTGQPRSQHVRLRSGVSAERSRPRKALLLALLQRRDRGAVCAGECFLESTFRFAMMGFELGTARP